jgi:hypothetical protein
LGKQILGREWPVNGPVALFKNFYDYKVSGFVLLGATAVIIFLAVSRKRRALSARS